jgi:hypothetical protein
MPVDQLAEGRVRQRRCHAVHDHRPGGGDRLVVPVGCTLRDRHGADAATAAIDRLIERLVPAHREEREPQVLTVSEPLDAARLDEGEELGIERFMRIWIIYLRSIQSRTSISTWHWTPAT